MTLAPGRGLPFVVTIPRIVDEVTCAVATATTRSSATLKSSRFIGFDLGTLFMCQVREIGFTHRWRKYGCKDMEKFYSAKRLVRKLCKNSHKNSIYAYRFVPILGSVPWPRWLAYLPKIGVGYNRLLNKLQKMLNLAQKKASKFCRFRLLDYLCALTLR